MLRELRIENLLLIERAELRLGEGLNAITGETGAGKTVLAHSLDLLMGGKAQAADRPAGGRGGLGRGRLRPARRGCSRSPELAELAERLPEGAEEVVLGRRVSAGGRTSAFVAGRAATAADLKLLGGRLLAFFGQHEHRRLTISSAQLEILDGFAGAEHLELRERYREAHRECGRLAAELAELREREGSRERDLDLYRYELAEIEEVAPGPRASGPSWRPSASGCATPRACARRPPAPTRALAGAEEDGGGAAAALAQAEALLQGGGRARPRPRRARRAGRGAGGRARRRRLGAARLRRGRSRPTRASWRRSRSGWKRSTGSSASTAAASSRCSPTPSAAGRRSRGWRAPRSAAPRPRRRWPTAERAPRASWASS